MRTAFQALEFVLYLVRCLIFLQRKVLNVDCGCPVYGIGTLRVKRKISHRRHLAMSPSERHTACNMPPRLNLILLNYTDFISKMSIFKHDVNEKVFIVFIAFSQNTRHSVVASEFRVHWIHLVIVCSMPRVCVCVCIWKWNVTEMDSLGWHSHTSRRINLQSVL